MKHANSLYSIEDELFPRPKKSKWAGMWKWAIAVALGWTFVFQSTRPTVRLSAEPPPSFYVYNHTWSPEQRQEQRRLAQAYWSVAVNRIQKVYSHNKPLPQDPPPQFRVAVAAANLETDMIDARIHYWYRLREVWTQRDAWVETSGWNTGWVDNTLNSLPQYVPQPVANTFQSLVSFFDEIGQKISVP